MWFIISVLLVAIALSANTAEVDMMTAAMALEELLSNPIHMAALEQTLAAIAKKQLQPFIAGVSQAQLNMVHLWNDQMGHGLLRVRILDGRVFVRKLQGTRARGEVWSDRQLGYLDGVLSMVETQKVPDVDFVVSLLDVPLCQYLENESPLPVFVFAKKRSCKNILVPDHSLMHDEYQHPGGRVFGSSFHWRAIVGKALTRSWDHRKAGIFWDGDFGKGIRRGLQGLRAYLEVGTKRPEKRWNMEVYTSPSEHCNYQKSLNAQGNSWSMRLKNIFMCGTVAIWYQPHVEQQFQEYWYEFLEEGKHFLQIRADSALSDLTEVLQIPEKKLRRIADHGFNYTAAILRPAAVQRYLAILLGQYATLQKFSPAAAHAVDYTDFKEITRSTLGVVRDHSAGLGAQNFHFHYPEKIDFGDEGLARALDTRSLHALPCWGRLQRIVTCCSPSNRWKYQMNTMVEPWGDLHPFCVPPGADPVTIWRSCCNRTVINLEHIFGLAMDRHPPARLLDDMDAAILAFDLSAVQAEALLQLSRDTAVNAVMNHNFFNKALLGVEVADEPPLLSLAGKQINRAWFYEEVLKAVCTCKCIVSESCCDNSCSDMSTLDFLTQKRQRQIESVQQPSGSTLRPLSESSFSGEAEIVDILLLLSAERNELALASMLANRACPLRLHLLASSEISTDWVYEFVVARNVSNVLVKRQFPQTEANFLAKYLDYCGGGTANACDVIYAALVPQTWLHSNSTLLPFFDLTEQDRGPFFMGDICRLYHEYKASANKFLVWAPRHLEYARWGITKLSTDVLLFDLMSMQSQDLSTLFSEAGRYHKSEHTITALGSLKGFMSTWLNHLSSVAQPPKLALLPPAWWFVPYEAWFYNMDWPLLLSNTCVRRIWDPVLRKRQYLGYDAVSRQVKLHCAPPASFMPVALLNYWPPFQQRYLYATFWPMRIGSDNCGALMAVMSLQWERADRPPGIPFSIRDLPWVAEWLALYESL